MLENNRSGGNDEEKLREVLQQLIRQLEVETSQSAYEVCRKLVPTVVEDAQLLVANLPHVFSGFWTKAYSRLSPHQLFEIAESKGRRLNNDLVEMKTAHFGSASRAKSLVFNKVYEIVREQMRPKSGERSIIG